MVMKAYKFRCYPTKAQQTQLAHEFGSGRFIWNTALEMMSRAYKEQGQKISTYDVSKQFTQLKKDENFSWLKTASATALNEKLCDLEVAFKNFFAGRAKYPRFKKRLHKQTVRYQVLRSAGVQRRWQQGALHLPKLGGLDVRWHRRPKGTPKMATLSKDPDGRYYISMAIEEHVEHKPITGQAVGVDMGIKHLCTLSNGKKIDNPKYLKQYLRQLRHQSRNLGRKQKGSKRWQRQRVKVARLHAKIRDSRRHALHVASSTVINESQVIVVEDLNVSGMLRNRRLSRALSDASMGEFLRMLEYKAQWYGRTLIKVDRWFPSSKTCSGCGHKLDELRLDTRHWQCPQCGAEHDRDINAANNILNEGLGRWSSEVKREESDTQPASVVAKPPKMALDETRKPANKQPVAALAV